MIPVVVVETFAQPKPRWGDLRVGDGLMYPDGGLFIVESNGVDDGEFVTFLLRCVVSPDFGNFAHGELSMLGRPNDASLYDLEIVKLSL